MPVHGRHSKPPIFTTVMSLLVCSGDRIFPAWKYDGPELPFDGSVQCRWIRVDGSKDVGRAEGLKTTYAARTVYGLLIAGAVILGIWRVSGRDQKPR